MELIRAVLIDDEADTLRTLQLLLKKYCEEVDVVATFNDPKAALKELPKLNPELIFLDVQMPGMTGFELLEKIPNLNSGVIFVTAHSAHAIRAIKFSALDFLLKPVEANELKESIEKFKKRKNARPDSAILHQLAKNIEFLANPVTTKIAVSTQEGIEIVQLNDVDYLKADRNYTLIKRNGKKDLLVSKPLKDFTETLTGTQFMRIHSGYLVNLQKVVRYVRADGGYAVMDDGTEITVSRSHKDDFLKFLKA